MDLKSKKFKKGQTMVEYIIITEKSHYSFADNGRLCGSGRAVAPGVVFSC